MTTPDPTTAKVSRWIGLAVVAWLVALVLYVITVFVVRVVQ